MSTAENQHEETTTQADRTTTSPASPVWPRGVHSASPTKMDEPHAEQLTLGIVVHPEGEESTEEASGGDHPRS